MTNAPPSIEARSVITIAAPLLEIADVVIIKPEPSISPAPLTTIIASESATTDDPLISLITGALVLAIAVIFVTSDNVTAAASDIVLATVLLAPVTVTTPNPWMIVLAEASDNASVSIAILA